MNPHLHKLHAYPFEKLAALLKDITPPKELANIALSIGEPKHAAPDFIQEALVAHLQALNRYPTTKGLPVLRETIAAWISRRFSIPISAINSETHILPVNGSREALFSLVQAVIDPSRQPVVVMPNPFYQIYEGAALLAGAEAYYLNTTAENNYLPDFDAVPVAIWERCQLLFICSPGNPTGAVIDRQNHQKLLALAEQYDFIIASDECYSELYDDESQPPPGILQSAYNAGHTDFRHCVSFQSLSKRSNVPGLRSGFVAGDATVLEQYLKYRTYHGCAMSVPSQYASIAAWQDEAHVKLNRQLYRDKFTAFIDILSEVCEISRPTASFFIWLKTIGNHRYNRLENNTDTEFAQQLFAQQNITVLPGSYLSRESDGINPGANHVRIALVAPLEECVAAAQRIKFFLTN